MLKRKRETEGGKNHCRHAPKRVRTIGKNPFQDLSDELILRTLSFLSVPQLTQAELVCQRFRRLASDNEIWKEKFYLRFVRPRARRLPTLNALKPEEREREALYYASRSAKWLEYNVPTAGLSTRLAEPDWKRRYKVKLNWTKGRCKAREVSLDCPQQPRTLVRIFQGTIYTADEKKLRSYSQRRRPQILNTHYWQSGKVPSAMAVGSRGCKTFIIIGFSNGSLEVLESQLDGSFAPLLEHGDPDSGTVTAVATAWPYILTMTANRQMTLLEPVNLDNTPNPTPLAVLASLRSDAVLLPVSLSVRRTTSTLIASIAYSFSRINAGWCVGLQEIRLGLRGDVLGSRLTSTVETPLRDFPLRTATISSRSASTAPFAVHPNLMNPPTSLSHSGCYILAGLPDNTLMVYTVISNENKLEISGGRRLFGHTCSVSGAEVSDRGKALSISEKGDEIRVWELEDLLSSWSLQKSSTQLQPQYGSDDIATALVRRGSGLGLAFKEMKDDLAWSCHWVGFDDEQVVVLGERNQRQILSCYDFA